MGGADDVQENQIHRILHSYSQYLKKIIVQLIACEKKGIFDNVNAIQMLFDPNFKSLLKDDLNAGQYLSKMSITFEINF